MENFILTADLQYEALSYVWGDATITRPILLNGNKLEVTTNLQAALWGIECEDKERLLWIDSICIDQRSIPERNMEVKRMHLNYQRAAQVIVWLGRETDPEDIIEAGDALITEASTLAGKLLEMLSKATEENDVLKVFLQTGDDILALQVLGKMFCRPWFLCIWVMQEIALAWAAVVAYGPQRIPRDQFVRAIEAIRSLEYGLNNQLWRMSGAGKAYLVQVARLDAVREDLWSSADGQLVHLLWQLRVLN